MPLDDVDDMDDADDRETDLTNEQAGKKSISAVYH